MISVLLVDEHRLLRDGVKVLLETVDGTTVISEACDGRQALAMIERHPPDVVLVHVRDDRGKLVGESMDPIRSVDPREEKLGIFEVVTDSSAAECVVAMAVRL